MIFWISISSTDGSMITKMLYKWEIIIDIFLLSVELFHDILIDFGKRLLNLPTEDRFILKQVFNHLQEKAVRGS